MSAGMSAALLPKSCRIICIAGETLRSFRPTSYIPTYWALDSSDNLLAEIHVGDSLDPLFGTLHTVRKLLGIPRVYENSSDPKVQASFLDIFQ